MKLISKYTGALIILFSGLVMFCGGCATTGDQTVNLQLDIKTQQSSNDGKVFYVLAVNDTEQAFMQASYQSVYDKFLSIDDANKILVKPGNDTTMARTVTLDKGKPVSVYFMFTKPGGAEWKYRINDLSKDTDYTFTVGENTVTKIIKDDFWI